MSKGFGEKLLGLFIEDVDAPPSAREREAAEGETARDAAPAVPRVPRATDEAGPTAVVAPGASHDAAAFAAVYRRFGLPDADRERLAKVLHLVASLPAEATPEVKRAIVGASLEAFGVPVDGVVGSADAATAALDAYVLEGQRRTEEVLDDAEKRIAKLSAEVEEVRRLMSLQVAAQQELVRATAVERARVRVAADFFGGGAHVEGGQVTRLRRVR